jgi:hypothetical protein
MPQIQNWMRQRGIHVVQTSILPNFHVNGYQSLNQKPHQRDAIDTPQEHISIKWRAIADCTYNTLCSPIL